MPEQLEMFATEDAPARCLYCGAVATHLCDGLIGIWSNGGKAREYFTCDLPMCDRCRSLGWSAIACIRSGTGKGCHEVTTDYCRRHAEDNYEKPLRDVAPDHVRDMRMRIWGEEKTRAASF